MRVLTHLQARTRSLSPTSRRGRSGRSSTDPIRDYFTGIIGAEATLRKPIRVLAPLFEGAPPIRNRRWSGDGVNDILLAKNAGYISCALLNGLGAREDLLALEPDYACERLSELIDLFV